MVTRTIAESGIEPVESVDRERKIDRYVARVVLPRLYEADELDFQRMRAQRETADKTEMENKVRRGELIEADVVHKTVGTAIQSAKTRLLAIPSQIARYLENQDAHNIQTQLDDVIFEALDELAEQPFGEVETAETANG
jgi:phage terminase Nu1 subunit (DNA packaging protein)